MKRSQRGFSLIELMVVIAIIAIMMALAVPSFGSSVRASKERSAVQKLTEDFMWARSAAGSPDASTFSSLVGTPLTGAPTIVLTINANATWTTTIDGYTDAKHSIDATTLGNLAPNIAVSGLTLPAQFTFSPQGFVTTTGAFTYTGASGQQFPLQVLYSGAIFRTNSQAS